MNILISDRQSDITSFLRLISKHFDDEPNVSIEKRLI